MVHKILFLPNLKGQTTRNKTLSRTEHWRTHPWLHSAWVNCTQGTCPVMPLCHTAFHQTSAMHTACKGHDKVHPIYHVQPQSSIPPDSLACKLFKYSFRLFIKLDLFFFCCLITALLLTRSCGNLKYDSSEGVECSISSA